MSDNTPKYIVVHCTDVPTATQKNQFYAVDRYHQSQGFPKSRLGYYGGYHVIIGNGASYRYRDDDEQGAHCNTVVDGLSVNFQSLGICWMGDGDIETPSAADIELLKDQIQKWCKLYAIPPENVVPHRRFTGAKTCPGTLLADNFGSRLAEGAGDLYKHTDQLEKQKKIVELSHLFDSLRSLLYQLQQMLGIRK